MGDGKEAEAWTAVAEHIQRAEDELRAAAAILRGKEIPPSVKAMKVEQQVSRSISSLWGIDI